MRDPPAWVAMTAGLILAEQTLLIALDDETGRDATQWGSDVGLAGALLLDLARLGLVGVNPEGKVVDVGEAELVHEVVRDAYTAIRESSERRNADGWVRHLPRELKALRERLACGLVGRGILSEEESKRLGVLPTTRFPAVDPAPERDVRRRLREVLLTGRDPSGKRPCCLGFSSHSD
jgi:hypothetical protein